MHVHKLDGISKMVSMSMSDQDIVDVQTLFGVPLRELHRTQTKTRYERVTQERIDQNRDPSCLDKETSVSQPDNFRYHRTNTIMTINGTLLFCK